MIAGVIDFRCDLLENQDVYVSKTKNAIEAEVFSVGVNTPLLYSYD